ncbi:hypothetical protein C84B14_09537 [Salinisphaera sp. C84B14]|uniref:hypothetical protein n=1 Tax=unclassified Salinisphaera TaxID=2649847 RepID=UPI000C523927|nr:hypothetical protein [Salinisphaera sp.]MBS63621.1 hypothetical protein [Salinisphaera sp.]|tara:strand:- start:1190 stop:1417 length:228 start_codon:yes stop_codon:yes gene_type:complete
MENKPRRRSATGAYIVFLIAAVTLMTVPVFTFADRVEPLVFGLPFNLFWIVLVELAAFVAILCFYVYEHGRGSET